MRLLHCIRHPIFNLITKTLFILFLLAKEPRIMIQFIYQLSLTNSPLRKFCVKKQCIIFNTTERSSIRNNKYLFY